MDMPCEASLSSGRSSLGGIHATYFDLQIISAILKLLVIIKLRLHPPFPSPFFPQFFLDSDINIS